MSPPDSPKSKAESVLWVIEDHPGLRQTVGEVLESAGFAAVRLFGSCEEALSAAKASAGTRAPAPDAILLDIGLPGIDGIEGAGLLKEKHPGTQIVIFTVSDEPARVFEAVRAGASGYLLKSEPPARIVAALEEVLGGGSPMTPEIARLVLERFSRLEPSETEVDLSEREIETLRLLVEGLAKKEIAERLQISTHTVDTYVRRIYRKLHVHTVGGAVAKALREGLV